MDRAKGQNSTEFSLRVSLSGTYIVVEEEQPLLGPEVPVLQPVLLHEWCLPGHDVLEAHLLEKHLDQDRSP